MRFFLAANNRTEEQIDRAQKLIAFLEDCMGGEVSMTEESSIAFYGDTDYARFGTEDCDMVVSLGGDGAVLRASWEAVRADKPLLGVNSGRLGYLCTLGFDEVDTLLQGGLAKLRVTERSLLEVEGIQKVSVNDVFIIKNNPAEAIDLEIHYGRNGHMRFRGDGVILCTPTGSSAYSRSAGGPIIDGEAPVFCITPICPHMSEACPVIVNNDDVIRIDIHKAEGGVSAYMDGTLVDKAVKSIVIRKSERKLKLLTR